MRTGYSKPNLTGICVVIGLLLFFLFFSSAYGWLGYLNLLALPVILLIIVVTVLYFCLFSKDARRSKNGTISKLVVTVVCIGFMVLIIVMVRNAILDVPYLTSPVSVTIHQVEVSTEINRKGPDYIKFNGIDFHGKKHHFRIGTIDRTLGVKLYSSMTVYYLPNTSHVLRIEKYAP